VIVTPSVVERLTPQAAGSEKCSNKLLHIEPKMALFWRVSEMVA